MILKLVAQAVWTSIYPVLPYVSNSPPTSGISRFSQLLQVIIFAAAKQFATPVALDTECPDDCHVVPPARSIRAPLIGYSATAL